MTVRAVIAEDAPLLRHALALVLREGGIDVVGQAADVPSLLAAVEVSRPDVAMVDLRMPPNHCREGLDAALHIKATNPGVGVAVLSQHVDGEVAELLFDGRATGVGYLLKERCGSQRTFIESLENVAAGGCVLDPEVVTSMMTRRRRVDPVAELTPREREVLALMAQGMSNLAIARALHLGERTVETHVARIFRQFRLDPSPEVNRRVHAVLVYLRSSGT